MDANSYIQANLSKEITVNHLAGRANLQDDYLSWLFLNLPEIALSSTFMKSVLNAQYLITTSNMTFEQIATEEYKSLFKRVDIY